LPPHRGAVFKQRPLRFGRFHWSAVTHPSSVAGLCRRTVARVSSNALNVSGAVVGWGGERVSSVADSLPPHRGAVFKQRPCTTCCACFGRGCWVGRDGWFQRGGSMPPHRGVVFKQRPLCFGRSVGRAVSMYPAWQVLCRRTVAQCSSNALNVSGAVVGRRRRR
jgi:hypothetical protein